MKPYYEDTHCTIYHAGSEDLIDILDYDAVISDLPYGVNLGDVDNGQARAKNQASYTQFKDTPEYLLSVCVPIITKAIGRAKRAALFCGNRNLWLYPPAAEVGCWYIPCATSRGRWGFNTSNVILYYGTSPRAGIGDTASSFEFSGRSEKNGHPCPKPNAVMSWLVNKASSPNDTILDPFMGSGTTLRAAKDLGRKSIGIEIEEKYCEIAALRCQQECLQFLPPEPKQQDTTPQFNYPE